MLAETSIQCCSRVALFLIGLSVVACVMVNIVDFWGFKRNKYPSKDGDCIQNLL